MDAADSAVVRRVCEGDRDAFRILVERHSRSLFRLAYRMTSNRLDAEDVVQETLLRAYRQLTRFDHRSEFGTWLYRIATNCALDLLRSRQRRKEARATDEGLDPVIGEAADEPVPERLALSGQIRRMVDLKLAQLTPLERTAFLLRHVEGMSIDQISEVIGRNSASTKHSVFRAVQKLRTALAPLARTTL